MHLVLQVKTGEGAPQVAVVSAGLQEKEAWEKAFQLQFDVVVGLVKENGLVTPKTEDNAKLIDALLNPVYPTYESGDFTELCKIHDALCYQDEGIYFYVLTL